MKQTIKYVNADKIKTEIKRIGEDVMKKFSMIKERGEEPNVAYSIVNSQMQMLLTYIDQLIDQMQQVEPMPPGIENESTKEGWLDYAMTLGEIGLHRYNAIHRIKEHKEQFDPLTIPNLYHIAEYYESIGAERTCCCLQRYCMDFRFEKEEVKNIINKED